MDKDLISRQAAIHEAYDVLIDGEVFRVVQVETLLGLPSAEPRWIPVKTRPMDEEERAYWSEHLGYDIEYEDAVMFDCKMPDDGQEILVSFRRWVSMDRCEIDGGLYGLDGNGDWDGVVAWMPLPEPYKGENDG